MSQKQELMLKDGQVMEVAYLTYPIGPRQQIQVIQLLQQEWARTDVDWLQSMRGAYSDTLRTHLALGMVGDDAVGTASIAFASDHPEVAVVEDVMTRQDFRGLGIAANLTEQLVRTAWEAGCRVVYLGNTPRPASVYEKIGFQRLRGVMMRRPSTGDREPEKQFYAPGQATRVRPTNWGDLPSVACLMAQPMESLMVDFNRGLVSSRYAAPVRCVSNFTVIWYSLKALGGLMLTLGGEGPHRVLGFASITPGPAPLRSHSAVIDAVTHDNYTSGLEPLLDRLVARAQQTEIQLVQAYVAASDRLKTESFRSIGLSPVATLPEAIRLSDRSIDVILMQRRLN